MLFGAFSLDIGNVKILPLLQQDVCLFSKRFLYQRRAAVDMKMVTIVDFRNTNFSLDLRHWRRKL